ncbi:MAG: hypothetical protein Q8867_09255 [Bacteroidota bacterium]|nr:hypothetical protein [Bacteroidota bacterium]
MKYKIANSAGLSVYFMENGAIESIEADPIRICLKVMTPFSKPGTVLYLRKRTDPFNFIALTGPESNSRFGFSKDAYVAEGVWEEMNYRCILKLSENKPEWKWIIDIYNKSENPVEFDLFYVQDIGLKQISGGVVNEYYVSQYIERRIFEEETYGSVVCCRQNMKESTGNPWVMIACKNKAIEAGVDGMQFFGRTFRQTGIPEGLLSESGGEYAGESSVVSLHESPVRLAAGEHHHSVFAAVYMPDHPGATSEDDLLQLKGLFDESSPELISQEPDSLITPVKNLFNATSFLPAEDLTGKELDTFFEGKRRHGEYEQGRLLSFFYGENRYVMLHTAEILADRPFGNIMQAKSGCVPDENIVSTTSYAFGVFNSHLTQGNTNFNILLSICASPFNLDPETGQRIFVETEGRKYLLGIPSAFEMGLNFCRWIYKFHGQYFQVRTWTSRSSPRVNTDFRVLSGKSIRLLVTHHFDGLNGWKIIPGTDGEYIAKPAPGSMISGKFPDAQFRILLNGSHEDIKSYGDEALFEDRKNHGTSLFILETGETSEFCMSFLGEVSTRFPADKIAEADVSFAADLANAGSSWKELSLDLSLKSGNEDIDAIQEILPWYGMNALTHFLTPYGLEQFSGAAWGTRDVAQGPFDFLMTMEKYEPAKQVLRILFSNQDPDGGWPQWWMFDSYPEIRADSSHSDIFYWCILAVCNYIKTTGDLKILDEEIPYFEGNKNAHPEKTPLREHIDRLILKITGSFIPGTALVPYGGGDWNDSLQPVSKDLADRMISSWTVEMNYQAFNQYRKVYEISGDMKRAKELEEICTRIKEDFNKYLIKDGVVAGYGLVEGDHIHLLLHPEDETTHIHYSLLPMERGILSELFTKEQAFHHQDLIEKYLKGPDGARLMDHPLRYRGGIQTFFQRAESSTFFGREIGLMYTHEHIRYAESLAYTGKADAFLKALRQAIPVNYRTVVPCGDFRQANCYYSSSDVVFKSRYDADDRYDEIKTGKIPLRGGWRVYSSGPGIYIHLIVSKLLGLRIGSGHVIVDPVMSFSLNGLEASMYFAGHHITFRYIIKNDNFGPKNIFINKKYINFTYEINPYRRGGAVIPEDQFLVMLDKKDNVVEIHI